MSGMMGCYCGPPVFSRTATWQMCSDCLTEGCRFGELCRTGRSWVHPVPAWAVCSRLGLRRHLSDERCARWIRWHLRKVTAAVNQEYGAGLPAGIRLKWNAGARAFEAGRRTAR